MAPKSAPILNTFAKRRSIVQKYKTFFEKCLFILVARPTPVVNPMRAHISWIVTIKGKEKSESQIKLKPREAPICE